MAQFMQLNPPTHWIRRFPMIRQLMISISLSIVIFFLAFHLKVEEVGVISNLNALMIVLGGTFASTLIAYPWKKFLWTLALIKKSFQRQEEIGTTIQTIVHLARAYRQGGIRTLEQQGEKLSPGLLKTSVELIAIQCPRERMEQIVQKEAQLSHLQFETAYKILYSMARLAPALGLAGTIVTLIRVFGHLTDPQSLVGSMAIALFSTFYGVVLANLGFVPLANKVRDFMEYEEVKKELIQEGILDIYDEENPRAIQFKLEALSSAAMKPAPAWSGTKFSVVPSKKRISSVAS
jgi:chemotaxis protein MotA